MSRLRTSPVYHKQTDPGKRPGSTNGKDIPLIKSGWMPLTTQSPDFDFTVKNSLIVPDIAR